MYFLVTIIALMTLPAFSQDRSYVPGEVTDSCIGADGHLYVLGYNNVARYSIQGDLDMSFGQGGYKSTPSAYPTDWVCRPDGRTWLHTLYNSRIYLLDKDFEIDPDFGVDGSVPLEQGILVYDLTPSPASGLYMVGTAACSADEARTCFRVDKLNHDGKYDSQFGSSGIFELDLQLYRQSLKRLVRGDDGSLYVLGFARKSANSFGSGIFVAKLNEKGELCTDFGEGGYTFHYSDIEASHAVLDLDRLPSGGFLVTGVAPKDQSRQFGVLALDSKGMIDTGFGDSGFFSHNFGDANEYASRSIVTEDGIFVAGVLWDFVVDDSNLINRKVKYAFAHLHHDGSLNEEFGRQGLFKVDTLGDYASIGDGGSLLEVDGNFLFSETHNERRPNYSEGNKFLTICIDPSLSTWWNMLCQDFGTKGIALYHESN